MEFLIGCIIFVIFLAVGDTVKNFIKVRNNKYDEKEYKIYHNGEE
jgi:hypothetical protein